MRRAIMGGVAVGTGILVLLVLRIVASDVSEGTDFAYRVLLSGPDSYPDGTYFEEFELSAGSYRFKFIPSGSSPQYMTIGMTGEGFEFSEYFELEGTTHKSPISEYLTWDYTGDGDFEITQGQRLGITIDPHGGVDGSVSILIVRL